MDYVDETEANAFRQSIIENPHDDAPRLIYADWLDDHGLSWLAEFIRWQCYGALKGEETLAFWLAGTDAERCDDLIHTRGWYEGGAALCPHRFHGWFRDFCPEIVGSRTSWSWVWRRGFVDELYAPATDVLNHLGELGKIHPITQVSVTRMTTRENSAVTQNRIWRAFPSIKMRFREYTPATYGYSNYRTRWTEYKSWDEREAEFQQMSSYR